MTVKRVIIFVSFLMLFALFGAGQLAAQSPAVQRPLMRVSDTWTYSLRHTGQHRTPDSQYTITITNADGAQITANWQDTVLASSGTLLFDADLNLIQRTRGSFIDFRATPSSAGYQWPLYIGSAWQRGYGYTTS